MEPRATRLPRSATAVVEYAVLGALAGGVGLSRAHLAERTGLSRAAVAGVTDRLLAEGRIEVAGTVPSSVRGRPARSYRLADVVAPLVLVSLLRDTRTVLSVVGGDGVVGEETTAGDWTRDPWKAWTRVLAARFARLEVENPEVVLMVPAPWHDDHGPPRPREFPAALRSKILSKGAQELPEWLDASAPARLSDLLGARVRVSNDANLAGLGELTFGAGRGSRVGIHLSVRDGIGACIVVDGRLVTGASGMAGELAHVQVDPSGGLCGCGNRGCLATTTSTVTTVDAVSALHGVQLSAADVDTLVDHADPRALRYFGDLARTLATALAGTVTMLNPDVLVVDAALGPAADAVVSGLRDELTHRCAPAVVQAVRITAGTLAATHAAGARALMTWNADQKMNRATYSNGGNTPGTFKLGM